MKANNQAPHEPATQSTLEEHFSAEEIAAYLRTDVEQFHSMAQHANLEAVEVQGELVYRAADVRRFLVNAGLLDGDSQW